MRTSFALAPLPASPALRALCLAGAIGMAAQVLLLAEPPIAHVVLRHMWDKCVHFLYFGTMAAFFYMAAGGRRPLAVWLLVAAIGALDETQQIFVPERTADVFDWLADALGAAAFLFVVQALSSCTAAMRAPVPLAHGDTPCAES